MNKTFFVNHTNRLLQIANNISMSKNINKIPFPKDNFKSGKDYKTFLNNLTNFIDKPELFFLSKLDINTVDKFSRVNEEHFRFIKK